MRRSGHLELTVSVNQETKPCRVEGCRRPAGTSRSLCRAHYQAWRRGISLPGLPDPASIFGTCSAAECDRPVFAKGLCLAHRRRCLRNKPLEGAVREYLPIAGKNCIVDGCNEPVKAKCRCSTHYERYLYKERRRRRLQLSPPDPSTHCHVEGCHRRIYTRGLCRPHFDTLVKMRVEY